MPVEAARLYINGCRYPRVFVLSLFVCVALLLLALFGSWLVGIVCDAPEITAPAMTLAGLGAAEIAERRQATVMFSDLV